MAYMTHFSERYHLEGSVLLVKMNFKTSLLALKLIAADQRNH